MASHPPTSSSRLAQSSMNQVRTHFIARERLGILYVQFLEDASKESTKKSRAASFRWWLETLQRLGLISRSSQLHDEFIGIGFDNCGNIGLLVLQTPVLKEATNAP